MGITASYYGNRKGATRKAAETLPKIINIGSTLHRSVPLSVVIDFDAFASVHAWSTSDASKRCEDCQEPANLNQGVASLTPLSVKWSRIAKFKLFFKRKQAFVCQDSKLPR